MNLAEHLSDGQRVYVPKVGQTPPAGATPAAASGSAPGPVNINTANESQLDALPGVGPSTAQAIISYRTEHGPFASVDDLASVKGIGPSKLAQLKGLARV
jgi:competence protein ComEA